MATRLFACQWEAPVKWMWSHGGVLDHTRTQRAMRTRRIRNIQDVRINTALWQAAVRILES